MQGPRKSHNRMKRIKRRISSGATEEVAKTWSSNRAKARKGGTAQQSGCAQRLWPKNKPFEKRWVDSLVIPAECSSAKGIRITPRPNPGGGPGRRDKSPEFAKKSMRRSTKVDSSGGADRPWDTRRGRDHPHQTGTPGGNARLPIQPKRNSGVLTHGRKSLEIRSDLREDERVFADTPTLTNRKNDGRSQSQQSTTLSMLRLHISP